MASPRTIQLPLPTTDARAIRAIGDTAALDAERVSLFCSRRCPGDVILETYDLARAIRDGGTAVIGGFQTPMERECLRLLLRGSQPVIVCPARSIERMRIPREWRPALDDGRLLILSPFPAEVRRPTEQTAARRNRIVAALSDRALVAHAAPGGKTEDLARRLVESGKRLLTLDSPSNANLLALGAEIADAASVG